MSDAIIVALIAAAASVIGQLLISRKSSSETFARLEKTQAVTDAKIDELTREVREHNNFARRVPVLEEQIKGVTRRLDDIERAK